MRNVDDIKKYLAGYNPDKSPDLLLINSPLRPDYDENPKDDYDVLPPLGVATLATHAKEYGHTVGVLDAEHYGLGVKEITSGINTHLAPRVVGINVLTPARVSALELAKGLNADVPLVIGGAHATALPEETLREFSTVHANTLLIRGEAEVALTQLLNGDRFESIPGLWYLEGENVRYSDPHPQSVASQDILPLDHNFLANDPSVDSATGLLETRQLTSRGCPFDCTYCAGSRTTLQLPVRNHGLSAITEELSTLFHEHGAMGIRFIDDLFISSEKRARAVLSAIEQAGLPLLYWDATGRANILSRFSNETLDFLRDHRAHEIAIGIESGSERLRKKIRKQVSREEIFQAVRALVARNIHVKGYFIVGLPSETKTETAETFRLATELLQESDGLFRASIFAFRPYPGTTEWNELVQKGFAVKDLLAMHASGHGERAKHSVTTDLQFAELPPQALAEMIDRFQHIQKRIIAH